MHTHTPEDIFSDFLAVYHGTCPRCPGAGYINTTIDPDADTVQYSCPVCGFEFGMSRKLCADFIRVVEVGP